MWIYMQTFVFLPRHIVSLRNIEEIHYCMSYITTCLIYKLKVFPHYIHIFIHKIFFSFIYIFHSQYIHCLSILLQYYVTLRNYLHIIIVVTVALSICKSLQHMSSLNIYIEYIQIYIHMSPFQYIFFILTFTRLHSPLFTYQLITFTIYLFIHIFFFFTFNFFIPQIPQSPFPFPTHI